MKVVKVKVLPICPPNGLGVTIKTVITLIVTNLTRVNKSSKHFDLPRAQKHKPSINLIHGMSVTRRNDQFCEYIYNK